jgi:hypothetical protein
LAISLLEITEHKLVKNIKTSSTQIKVIKKTNIEAMSLDKVFSDDFIKKETVTMNVVYNGFNQSGNYQKAL